MSRAVLLIVRPCVAESYLELTITGVHAFSASLRRPAITANVEMEAPRLLARTSAATRSAWFLLPAVKVVDQWLRTRTMLKLLSVVAGVWCFAIIAIAGMLLAKFL